MTRSSTDVKSESPSPALAAVPVDGVPSPGAADACTDGEPDGMDGCADGVAGDGPAATPATGPDAQTQASSPALKETQLVLRTSTATPVTGGHQAHTGSVPHIRSAPRAASSRISVKTGRVVQRGGVYEADWTKDDGFFYVYGLLHSQDYRETYAADLKKMLPRIPLVATSADTRAFADAGRSLSDLHIGYESVAPYKLEVP